MSISSNILNSALAATSKYDKLTLLEQAVEEARAELQEATSEYQAVKDTESSSLTIELSSDLYSVSIWTVNAGNLPSRYPNTVQYYLVDEGLKLRSPEITDITVEGN
jgi:hypothetical protein